MATEHMKKKKSLVINEMQIKITMRCYIPTKKTKIKNIAAPNVNENIELVEDPCVVS